MSDGKRIVILTADAGFGHRSAANAVALALQERWLDRDAALMAARAQKARALGRPQAAYDIAEHAWAAAERGPGPVSRYLARARPRLVKLLGHHGQIYRVVLYRHLAFCG
ncbi:MAG: hypothetical protein JXA89_22370 [Anaerolineae bacterium]|nr:hypothetical protein [Anaerolineae bacterium]